jgi:hypothetical protein
MKRTGRSPGRNLKWLYEAPRDRSPELAWCGSEERDLARAPTRHFEDFNWNLQLVVEIDHLQCAGQRRLNENRKEIDESELMIAALVVRGSEYLFSRGVDGMNGAPRTTEAALDDKPPEAPSRNPGQTGSVLPLRRD